MTVAGWLEPTLRHLSELRQVRSGLVVQLGGPVGNLAAYGEKGAAVADALAARLGLAAPALPWHSDRSRIAALAAALERCARTMARVGLDIALLASSDIAEITVRPGGSSSMSEKRNPIDSVRAIAAAELATAGAEMITGARLSELDRGIGGWHAEWVGLPLVFQATAATVEAMTDCLGSVEVDGGRMSALVAEVVARSTAPHRRRTRRVRATRRRPMTTSGRTGTLTWYTVGDESARPLVMIHAMGADSETWDCPATPALDDEKGGDGGSPRTRKLHRRARPYTIRDLGEDVLDVATTAGTTDSTCAGCHWAVSSRCG